MNTNPLSKIGACALLITGIFALCGHAGLVPVSNTSLAPDTFECYLTAKKMTVTIAGQGNVQAMVYVDSSPLALPLVATNGIPVPVLNLKLGQTIICHFTNALPDDSIDDYSSIHWHGIELDNDSDGTAVTQDAVRPTQTYIYQFKTYRPGVFWFQNHIDPGTTTFAGMYGVIIIPNSSEPGLIASKVLPPSSYTFPLALSDIDFDPTTGFVGKFYPGATPGFGTNFYSEINALAMRCHDNSDSTACAAAGSPGTRVIVNGTAPGTNAGSLSPLYVVPSGQRVRLQLMNESIFRDFRLTLRYPTNPGDTNLYRIGGQGGLLNNIRLEGGLLGTWDTKYNKGEIGIGSGERSDVLIYPTGTNGQIIQLVGNPLPAPFNLTRNSPNNTTVIGTNYPIAYFQIQGAVTNYTRPTNGEPLLAGSLSAVENLKNIPSVNNLTDPATLGTNALGTAYVGSTNPLFTLGNNSSGVANIDGVDAHALDGNLGNGAFVGFVVTNALSTRYARVGDLLELSVKNGAGAVHPWHLHGFSMQPVRMLDSAGNTNYNYDYNEFLDTIEVYNQMTLVYRVRMDYRPKMCDLSPNASGTNGPILAPCTTTVGGGALGRWLYHCHIFLHAGVGMIGELVVLDPLVQTNLVQQPSFTTNGIDVLASTNSNSKTVANGFISTNGNYITGITIWGSWNNDKVDANAAFELKFWSSVPPLGTNASRPGWQAWQQMCPPGTYTARLVATNSSPDLFFDPSQPLNFSFSDTNIYRYDFVIPLGQAFLPNPTNTYWLSVAAYSTNSFGWKTSVTNNNFPAAATWSGTTYGPNWGVLKYPSISPYAGAPIDTSFMLIGPGSGVTPGVAPHAISVPPTLELAVAIADGNISITWDGAGTLQYADDPAGPWNAIVGATSPYVAPADAPQRFYRFVRK